ncbi:MAG: hypothetical protein KBT63_11145 [Porticoccaceae bacterium]|nr:hypothetical protein [Porticoccaceae bacterium]
MLKKFLKRYSHINLALVDQAMVSGVNFLTGLLIARFLGIEAFGVFTLVWMSVLFVNSIQMAMISAPMMTIGPKQSDTERPGYYGAVVAQQLIFATVTSLLLWLGIVLSNLISPQWQVAHLALPLAMSLFFFQNQDFLRRLFFAEARPLAALINDAVSYLGQISLLMLFFLRASPAAADVLWIIAISSALAVLVGLFQLDKLDFNTSQLWSVFENHWVLSKWLTASAIMQWTSGNYFILTTGSLVGPVAVGALKATQNIIGVVHILFQGLENIVPSTASRHFMKDSLVGLKQYLLKVSFWGGGATVVIALAVSLSPDTLLRLIYGEQYQGYGYVLRWYALCYVFIFFSLPLRAGLRVLDASQPIFITYMLMTIFSISFAGVMVGKWGVDGAMMGILCTQIIMLFCLLLYFKTQLKKRASG